MKQLDIKRLFGVLLFIGLSVTIFAQASVTLDVDPYPTPQLALWADHQEVAMLTVVNTDPALEGTDYIIKTKMFLDGNLVLETNNDVDVQTFDLGTQTFLADEIIPYSALIFHDNNFKNQLIQTGLLPAGQYDFCVSLLNLDGTTVSTPAPVCEIMTITSYTMPELINPASAQNFYLTFVGGSYSSTLVPDITFTWSPLTPDPPPADGIKYIFTLMEVYDYQTPGQAFHVNYPLIEEEVYGTEFDWPSDLDAPEDSTGFVWSVKPVTLDDNMYYPANNGFVEPSFFWLGQSDSVEIPDCSCTNGLPEPGLTISQPEPTYNPRKLELNGVLDIVNNIFDCNDNLSDASHTITTTINWDSDHDAESIVNNGPFVHQFSETHEIPDSFCVDIKVRPKSGYNGGHCNKQYCVNVPQAYKDLNVGSITTGTISSNDTIYAGQNGEFAVALTQVSGSPSNYSGEGTVYVSWMNAPVNVEFQGITVDSTNRLITGVISARQYDGAPQFPADMVANAVSTGNWTNGLVDTLVEWMDAQGTIVIDKDGPAYVANPISVPYGIKFPSDDTLAVTEIIFEPNKAELSLIARKRLEGDWAQDQTVGFRVKNVHFHQNDIVMPPERLELIEDVTVGNLNGEINFTFVKPTGPTGGCYIQWDENGFDHFGIEINANFTRDWLLPIPDDGEKVAANFVGTASAWDDILLVGNLPQAELVKTDSMTLEVSNITMDLSDIQNPPGIVFPTNYPGGAETSNLFRGFYMQSSTLSMPRSWETHSGGPPNLTVQNLIINSTGFTFYAAATNVIQYPNASVADLGISIDTVYFDMVTNTMTDAGVIGKIGLPVAKGDSMQNPLRYSAIFSNAQTPAEHDNFQLTIEPSGPIYSHLLKGDLTLDPTSHIIAYVDSTKKTFESSLNGSLVWENKKLGPIKNVNFDIGFENLTFDYNSSQPNNKLHFSAGQWSFASPQKSVADFPVTIENINFQGLSTGPNQYVHGNLNFDLVVNLTPDIGGRATMGVEFSVDKNTASNATNKFVPKYLGTGISTIDVYAHLSAVSIDGSIAFRNDDPVYGNGFKGNLSATFKTPSVAINALAEFGNTSYQHSQAYRYWRVEADAIFSPGLPFLPGVAFYGFGGGAFKNMEATISGTSYAFTPHYGNWGLRVNGVIGTTPTPNSFNADVGLLGQFSSSGGLVNIGFTGAFYVGGPLTPASARNKAQVKGSIIADYNFPDKHFYMAASADINYAPTVSGNNLNMVLDVNGKTNKWFLKLGEPENTNNVNVLGVNLYSYLMAGNDIDPPSGGFTQTFKDSYNGIFGYAPSVPGSTGVNSNSATGKGFAFGVGMNVDKNVNTQVTGNYYIDLGIAAGAEINLSMMEYNGQNCANTSQRIGLNGYRAKGSIGFYAEANAQVQKINGGNVVQTWNLATVKAGGWLFGQFPRPTYVTGAVDGYVQIGQSTTWTHLLGDCKKCGGGYHPGHALQWTSCAHPHVSYLVNQSFHSEFEWGDSCDITQLPIDSGQTYAQGDAAADQQNKLIQYVHPLGTYNFPTASPIAVKYGLPLDESFDVSEQQTDGSIINRTFKLVSSVSMTEEGLNVLVATHENNLGESLYTKSVLQSMAGMTAMAPLIPPNTTNTGAQTPTFPPGAATSYPMVASKLVPGSANSTPPPPPPPIVNHLDSGKNYIITVTATLKEYKNNSWQNALKADGSVVTETISKTFVTGPMSLVANSGGSAK